jgi:hypothetical protein
MIEDADGSALRMFKNCHLGERCFVLGNGPSLQNTDLAPLADEITFGTNGIFYMTRQCGFTPTYYVVEDNHVFADNLTRIHAVEAVAKFFPSKYRPILEPRPDTFLLPTDWSFYSGSSEWYETPRFSHDIESVIYVGQSVTFLALQLASFMGFKEIYLVGVDYEYRVPEAARVDGLTITSVDDDPNHFHPEYFGKGKKWHLPKLDNVGKAMECARTATEEVGRTVFNATIGGKLEVFPRVDFRKLLDRTELQQPNSPVHYLVARSLYRAERAGVATVALDGRLRGTSIEEVVSASALKLIAGDHADLAITDRFGEISDIGRVLVLKPGLTSSDDQRLDASRWLFEVLVECLVKGQSAQWTRSVLELSPDGQSILVPTLGLAALRDVDPDRVMGIDDLGGLDNSRETRWVNGRLLSIGQIAELADNILKHDLSFSVIDDYVYLQSPWRATESPQEVLSLMLGAKHRKVVR